jgi:hypothetical protein
MSPTSYQTALPRSTDVYYITQFFFVKTIVEITDFRRLIAQLSPCEIMQFYILKNP